jgi:Na+/proline symporter
MQFLTRRYSPGTTYFYTVFSVIPNVLVLGISVYTLCVFVATAFGFHNITVDVGPATLTGIQACMLVVGLVITAYTLLGGLWAVMVTDSLQFIVLFIASLIVLPVAYLFLGDGDITTGVSRLINEAPEGFLGLKLKDRPSLFWLAYGINIILGYNVNWHIAQRYYSVPDERDTRKMAAWCAGFSLVLPLIWILPVLASRVLYPDLATMWPQLAEPTEAAFVTLALDVLPHGMLGIIVSAMFAATMSSADTSLNWLAAVLTKDAYVPLQKRLAGRIPTERTQLLFGKFSVATMGVIAIWIAFNMEKLGGVFDVHTKASSLYSAPMFIPVILGLVITRTPWWSGVGSFGFGVLSIICVSLFANVAHGLPADSMAALFVDIDLTIAGMQVTRYELQMLTGILSTSAFFALSTLLSRREGAYAERIAAFERDLATPAYADESAAQNLRGLTAYNLVGRLSLIIGGMLFLAVFPTLGDAGWELNVVGALMATAMGLGILFAVRRIVGNRVDGNRETESDPGADSQLSTNDQRPTTND